MIINWCWSFSRWLHRCFHSSDISSLQCLVFHPHLSHLYFRCQPQSCSLYLPPPQSSYFTPKYVSASPSPSSSFAKQHVSLCTQFLFKLESKFFIISSLKFRYAARLVSAVQEWMVSTPIYYNAIEYNSPAINTYLHAKYFGDPILFTPWLWPQSKWKIQYFTQRLTVFIAGWVCMGLHCIKAKVFLITSVRSLNIFEVSLFV